MLTARLKHGEEAHPMSWP